MLNDSLAVCIAYVMDFLCLILVCTRNVFTIVL